MANKRVNSINLCANSNKELFLIHGYSGSPTDFGDLPYLLNKEFDASVICPLLPGHGTKVEDLYKYNLENYVEFIENHLKREIEKGKKIVLIGISFGAQLALYLSSKYNISSLIICSITHKMRFPLNLHPIKILGWFKKKWKKHYEGNELELRKGTFYYEEMPSMGLGLCQKLRKLTEKEMNKICCPILSIHSRKEKVGSYKSTEEIFDKVSSKIKKKRIFNAINHNLFYSEDRKKVINEIINFIKVNKSLFKNKTKKEEKVSAIVPTYNEGKRILPVLKVLSKVKEINEIIVIDDGSADNIQNLIERFSKIRYVRNKINMGKGFSMDRGVKLSRNDILFFCDADLIGFKPEYAKEIIAPVMLNKFDMFIGMRGNFMQKTVKAWGLNSGERALRKKIWFNLPNYYKHRYRIEAGLNKFVNKSGKLGMGWKEFNYSQPIKEKKYGIVKGTLLRWWMNFDVVSSYIRNLFI